MCISVASFSPNAAIRWNLPQLPPATICCEHLFSFQCQPHFKSIPRSSDSPEDICDFTVRQRHPSAFAQGVCSGVSLGKKVAIYLIQQNKKSSIGIGTFPVCWLFQYALSCKGKRTDTRQLGLGSQGATDA